MKRETQIDGGARELHVETTTVEETQPSSLDEEMIEDKKPCVTHLAPHIQKLIDSGFRVGIERQKQSDSGHKRSRGRKRPRKRTRKQKEKTMSNVNEQAGGNTSPDSNVQPMPGLYVAAHYGKKALGITGRFLYVAAASFVGAAAFSGVSNWRANRAAAKALNN